MAESHNIDCFKINCYEVSCAEKVTRSLNGLFASQNRLHHQEEQLFRLQVTPHEMCYVCFIST